jgi:hypothetical protein
MVAALAGCHPPPSDYEVCSSYGLATSSEIIRPCMEERRERRAQAAMFLLSRPQPQPYYQQPYVVPYRAPVTTNCTRMGGGTVSCSSF